MKNKVKKITVNSLFNSIQFNSIQFNSIQFLKLYFYYLYYYFQLVVNLNKNQKNTQERNL